MATKTVTIATPAVVTHTAHAMPEGNMVAFTTTGALPTGITATTAYYIHVVNADTYNISTTRANALGGTYIATSGSQSGTHTGKELTGVIDEANMSIQDGGQSLNLSNVPLAVNVLLTNIVTGSRVRVSKASNNEELFLGNENSGQVSFATKFTGEVIVRVRKKGYIPYNQPSVITSDGMELSVSQELDTVVT